MAKYCVACGASLPEAAHFCPECGTAVAGSGAKQEADGGPQRKTRTPRPDQKARRGRKVSEPAGGWLGPYRTWVIVGAGVTIVALLVIGGQNRGGSAGGSGIQPVAGQGVNYQQLIQAAQRRLLQDPGDQQTIVRLANLYFDQGTELLARNNVQAGMASLNQAVTYYQRALETDPESPEMRTDLGTSYNRLQRKDEAIVEFMKVLEYRPDFVTAIFNLGVVHQQLGNTSAAREWYQRAAETAPGTTMGQAARERLTTLPPQ